MFSLTRRSKRAYLLCLALVLLFLVSAQFKLKSSSKIIRVIDTENFGDLLGSGHRNNFLKMPNYHNMAMDDPELLKLVKSSIFQYPSSSTYNLSDTSITDFSRGQSLNIDNANGQKERGYFVDIGAGNGETGSVSLYFERERHWTGVLIEPSLELYNQMINKHRQAVTANVCVRINATLDGKFFKDPTTTRVTPCLWLKTLLQATERTEIDLLIIDVKNEELSLLKTVPFDQIKIKFISVAISVEMPTSDISNIITFLNGLGFNANTQFDNHVQHTRDIVFEHK